MKIDKRNYSDIVYVLNNGIEQLITGDATKEDKRAIEKARKLISKLGYKPL